MSHVLTSIHTFIYFLYCAKIPIIPYLLNKIFIRILFGCQIGVETKLGKNVILGYAGLGTVIHDKCIIGDNVLIGTCVTVGGTTKKGWVPVVGENTIISTGAKILGPVTVGKNCVIGANAVVVTDIPDNSVAVGVPSKIIKRNINISEYRDVVIS